ncbi:MAG: hypothetical protein AABX05_06145, partial [Nanoarchaeota archaeon]
MGESLDKIEQDEPKRAIRNLRKGLRILRWVGRAENKIEYFENKVIVDLNKLDQKAPAELKSAVSDMKEKLEVAENELVKRASLFKGKVRTELLNIMTNEELLDKYDKDPDKAKQIRPLLKELVEDSKKDVNKLKEWLQSTAQILQMIHGLGQRLKKLRI